MKKIDRVLKSLSELYDFNLKLKAYKLKEKANKPLEKEAATDRGVPLLAGEHLSPSRLH